MPNSTDPFTLVADAIMACLKESQALAALVQPENFISFTDDKSNPVKEVVSTATFPEIQVLQSSSDMQLPFSSSSTKMIETYTIKIAGGSLKMHKLNPVRFATICALSKLKSKLEALRWNNAPFSNIFRLSSTVTGQTESDLKRGIQGFSAILNVSIELYFQTSALQGVL